jgi:hypothetical protein
MPTGLASLARRTRTIGCCRDAFLAVASIAALVPGSPASPAHAQRADAGDWIDTWAASPQAVWDADFFAPVGILRSLRNQTVRQIAHSALPCGEGREWVRAREWINGRKR